MLLVTFGYVYFPRVITGFHRTSQFCRLLPFVSRPVGWSKHDAERFRI